MRTSKAASASRIAVFGFFNLRKTVAEEEDIDIVIKHDISYKNLYSSQA